MCFKKLIKTFDITQYFFGIVALFCSLILLGSYFVERVLLIEPCILCNIQRLLFLSITVTCTVGFIINIIFINKNILISLLKNGLIWLCLSSTTLYAIIGSLIASRQSWLQIFASSRISSCSAGLQELLKQYNLITILFMAIKGQLECATIGLKILGLSLANWALLNFLIILLFGILVIYKRLSTPKKQYLFI